MKKRNRRLRVCPNHLTTYNPYLLPGDGLQNCDGVCGRMKNVVLEYTIIRVAIKDFFGLGRSLSETPYLF